MDLREAAFGFALIAGNAGNGGERIALRSEFRPSLSALPGN